MLHRRRLKRASPWQSPNKIQVTPHTLDQDRPSGVAVLLLGGHGLASSGQGSSPQVNGNGKKGNTT
eukprot:1161362-Pelagomonas_calceolata.AAC.6